MSPRRTLSATHSRGSDGRRLRATERLEGSNAIEIFADRDFARRVSSTLCSFFIVCSSESLEVEMRWNAERKACMETPSRVARFFPSWATFLGSVAASLASAIAVGCACDPPAIIEEHDGSVLVVDAEPRDPRLSCGESLRVRVLETPSGTRPELQSPRAARIDHTLVLSWFGARALDGTFPWHVATLSDSDSFLMELPVPWGPHRPSVFIDSDEGPLALLEPDETNDQRAWAAWDGETFGDPVTLPLDVPPDVGMGGIVTCEGRPAFVHLVYGPDDATGIRVIYWTESNRPMVSDIQYPSDGAFGSWRGTDPEAARPGIASCRADTRGVLHIVVLPGGVGRAPVLAKFGATAFSDPLAIRVGDHPASSAVLALDSSDTLRLFALTGSRLVMFEVGTVVRELGARELDVNTIRGRLVGTALGAMRTEAGMLVVYSNDAGTWALEWNEGARGFGNPILLTDLRCTTHDTFRWWEDTAKLVASCGVGVIGAELVQFEICGSST